MDIKRKRGCSRLWCRPTTGGDRQNGQQFRPQFRRAQAKLSPYRNTALTELDMRDLGEVSTIAG